MDYFPIRADRFVAVSVGHAWRPTKNENRLDQKCSDDDDDEFDFSVREIAGVNSPSCSVDVQAKIQGGRQ